LKRITTIHSPVSFDIETPSEFRGVEVVLNKHNGSPHQVPSNQICMQRRADYGATHRSWKLRWRAYARVPFTPRRGLAV
jgi:hypothetical protein